MIRTNFELRKRELEQQLECMEREEQTEIRQKARKAEQRREGMKKELPPPSWQRKIAGMILLLAILVIGAAVFQYAGTADFFASYFTRGSFTSGSITSWAVAGSGINSEIQLDTDPSYSSPASIQNFVTSVHGGGILVYQDSNTGIVKYRFWPATAGSENFTAEASVDAHGGSDAAYTVLRANHERDEIILGIEDNAVDLNLEVFNNSNLSGSWAALNEVSLDVASSTARKGYDLAYEDLSGEALIMFENQSKAITHDLFIQYVLFNGSRYSETNNITIQDPNGVEKGGRGSRILLFPRPLSDVVMAIIANTTKFTYAIPWNGSVFDYGVSMYLTNGTTSDTTPVHNFAWEGTSEEGLAFYINSTIGSNINNMGRFVRPYSLSTGWGEEVTIDNNGVLLGSSICADPFSDYIGIISEDNGNDVNVSIWDGSAILSGGTGPAQDGAGVAAGTGTTNHDCVWINSTSALFGYADAVTGIRYFFFHKPNTWSVTDITTAPQSPAFVLGTATKSLQFKKDSLGDEVMISAVNNTAQLGLIRYNITNNVWQGVGESPITTVDSANFDLYMFDWFRYDPGPNVTALSPASGSTFTQNDIVNIAANVSDNLLLLYNDTVPVLANISFPNGSRHSVNLSNTTPAYPGRFNFSLTASQTGSYTIVFLANDSHKNTNYTETTSFTVNAAAGGTAPLPLLISIDVINLSGGTSAQGGGFVVSSTKNAFANGTSLSADLIGSSGLSVVNLSAGIINLNLSLLRNATHGNYVNVTFAWVLAKTNGSTMLNATAQNNTANASSINYSFNANLLPDGIYNISVFIENISEGATRIVNYSRGFDIAVDRTPPNVSIFLMNVSNATRYRFGSTAGTTIQINVSLNDSTTFVREVIMGIISLTNGTEFNITPTKQGPYWTTTLALGPLVGGVHNIRIYANDTAGNVNSSVSNLSFILSRAPSIPVLALPGNGSSITNRTPIFIWRNSTDADGDVLSYQVQADDNRRFTAPEINVSSVTDASASSPEENTTWYSTVELAVDTRFYWRVRANDSEGYGNWSDGLEFDGDGDAPWNNSNFTVDSLLSITMFTSLVEFGEIDPGSNVNTTDGIPAPFRAENSGNIDANISLNASRLFTVVNHNTSYYQFRVRANNSNAFSTALSATGWTNMSASTTAAHVVNLTWRTDKRDFLTDINLTVPTDEPGGGKTSTITFTMTRNE